MKIRLLVAALGLSFSTLAMADLMYNAGEEFSKNPSGEEVTLDEGQTQDEAKEVGKDEVVIEKPIDYDANDVGTDSSTSIPASGTEN